MKIEVWSDYVCPFCYIGKRRLEQALESFAGKDAVEVVYKSFELDPNIPRDGNPGVYEMLSQKYGITREQAIANTQQITQMAKALGLEYNFEKTIQTNTFDAHRLSHYATTKGKHLEMTERLLKAHFIDHLHIGQHDTLAELAAEVGLDRQEALEVLESGAYADEVRRDEEEASRLGVRGVPFFVFNRKFAVSGAQPLEVFQQALQKAWQEEQPLQVLGGTEEAQAACTEDGCVIPQKRESAP